MRVRFTCIGLVAAPGLLMAAPVAAQSASASLAGTYNGSQPEVASELRLEPNGRFEYYLSYGALDEKAAGTWTADGEAIVLTSDPVRAPAFELLDTRAGSGRTLQITLDVPPQLPLQLFSLFLLEPDGTVSDVPFEKGPLKIALTRDKVPTKVAVVFPVYQLASRPYDIGPGTRAMRFSFVPNDLGKIAFDHQRLVRDGDAYVLQRFDRTLRFRKETAEANSGVGG